MFFECETKITKRIATKVFDPNDIDDLRQEVFIRFSKSLEKLKSTENLCGYLLKIADNIVNDHYRSKGKTKVVTIDESEDFINRDELIGDQRSIYEISLITYINQLPEKYREALILVEINGLSQKTVAGKLNISYSGLKSRVQRGRELLKKTILDCCDYKFDKYGNIISCCESNFCC